MNICKILKPKWKSIFQPPCHAAEVSNQLFGGLGCQVVSALKL